MNEWMNNLYWKSMKKRSCANIVYRRIIVTISIVNFGNKCLKNVRIIMDIDIPSVYKNETICLRLNLFPQLRELPKLCLRQSYITLPSSYLVIYELIFDLDDKWI